MSLGIMLFDILECPAPPLITKVFVIPAVRLKQDPRAEMADQAAFVGVAVCVVDSAKKYWEEFWVYHVLGTSHYNRCRHYMVAESQIRRYRLAKFKWRPRRRTWSKRDSEMVWNRLSRGE